MCRGLILSWRTLKGFTAFLNIHKFCVTLLDQQWVSNLLVASSVCSQSWGIGPGCHADWLLAGVIWQHMVKSTEMRYTAMYRSARALNICEFHLYCFRAHEGVYC